MGPSELFLHNGKIITLDGDSSVREAIHVRNGRIAAVGDGADLMPGVSPDARRIDLGGRSVTPGFFDSHAHMDREGLRPRGGIDIAGIDTIDGIVQAIAEVAQHTPKGTWIVVMPMGEPPHGYISRPEELRDGRYPDRHDLDRATKDHPVYIRAPWGWWSRPPFPAVANTMALQRAGIDADTVPPFRTEMLTNGLGEPTGVFLERNFTPILEYTLFRVVPRFNEIDRLESVRRGSATYARLGTTTIYEGHGLTPNLLNAFRDAHETGDLRLRTWAPLSVPTAAFDDARIEEMLFHWADRISGRGSGDDMLRYEGICLDVGDPTLADIISCHYPYEQWAGHFYQSLPHDRLVRIGTVAARLGIRVNCLVCYDLERVLRAYEEIDRQVSIRDQRWTAVHVVDASDEQIERMKRLGLVATVTPNFMYMAEDRFGLDKLRDRGIPIRRLLDAGVPVTLSSDNVPPSMIWTMWEALARWDADSDMRLGDSELTREEALRISTQSGHHLIFNDHQAGSLEPGKLADMVVLDEDPLTCDEDALRDLEPTWTFVGGHATHSPETEPST